MIFYLKKEKLKKDGTNPNYQEIKLRDDYVTAEKVKNAFLGLEYRQHMLMTLFAQWNEEYEKKVEGGLNSKTTLVRYKAI